MGDSWYGLRNDSTLIESGCQGRIINYEYGNISLLVFSNPIDRKGRQNMVVRTSNNEGENWQKEIPVYSGSAAYSCMTQIPDSNIGLLYETDNYNKIVFVVIPSGEL